MLRLNLIVCSAVLMAATLTGCDKGGDAKPAASQPAKPAAHAQPAAVPGSHDDWCGEHGVPESQCTRCDPALIPAFKATGDWCDEHGVPESQCLKCNPDLKIVRPGKAE